MEGEDNGPEIMSDYAEAVTPHKKRSYAVNNTYRINLEESSTRERKGQITNIMKRNTCKMALLVIVLIVGSTIASIIGSYIAKAIDKQGDTTQLSKTTQTPPYQSDGLNTEATEPTPEISTTSVDCSVFPLYTYDNSTKICFRVFIHFEELNWLESRKKCRDDGSHLMSFRNSDEFNAVGTKLIEKGVGTRGTYTDVHLPNVTIKPYQQSYVGIDGNDFETSEGLWVDWKGVALPWTHWSPSQPDNHRGMQNCMIMYKTATSEFFMFDFFCDEHRNVYFVCQKS